jgi:hypothetical protein
MDTNFDNSISDASQPNAGRVYDYFLGGNHNFEIDRKMAEQLLQKAPFIGKLAKLTRWFLGKVIRKAMEMEFHQFFDFASGLPTVDHIHSTAPEGTKIIYSDLDPITMGYAQEIIGDNPIVKYETCDAAAPEILLESGVVKKLFGDNQKTAIGYNGIFWFLSNDQIKHAMEVLYEWATPGSILYFTDYDGDNMADDFKQIMEFYKIMQQGGELRSKDQLLELVKPWTIMEPGLLTLEEWLDMPGNVTDEAAKSWGGGGLLGGFLKK